MGQLWGYSMISMKLARSTFGLLLVLTLTAAVPSCTNLINFNYQSVPQDAEAQSLRLVQLTCGAKTVASLYEGFLILAPGSIVCCTSARTGEDTLLASTQQALSNVTQLILMEMAVDDIRQTMPMVQFGSTSPTVIVSGIEEVNPNLDGIFSTSHKLLPSSIWLVLLNNPGLQILRKGIFSNVSIEAGGIPGVVLQNNSHVTAIEPGVFEGLTLGMLAIIEHSELQTLPENLFTGMPPMLVDSTVRLEYNAFRYLPHYIFCQGQFVATRSIYLYGNQFEHYSALPVFVSASPGNDPFWITVQESPNSFPVGSNNQIASSNTPILVDLSNSGRWLVNLTVPLEIVLNIYNLPDVQFKLGNPDAGIYDIGDCCTLLNFIAEPAGQIDLSTRYVHCSINGADPIPASEVQTKMSLCSCVDRNMVHSVDESIERAIANNGTLTHDFMSNATRVCIEAGSRVRMWGSGCMNATQCPAGYQAHRMTTLPSVPCGNLSLFKNQNIQEPNLVINDVEIALLTSYNLSSNVADLFSYECRECSVANCKSCQRSVASCSECMSGFFVFLHQNDDSLENMSTSLNSSFQLFQCLSECPPGFVAVDSYCQPCSATNCFACPRGPSHCSLCGSGTYLNNDSFPPTCELSCRMSTAEDSTVTPMDCNNNKLRQALTTPLSVYCNFEDGSNFSLGTGINPPSGVIGRHCNKMQSSTTRDNGAAGLISAAVLIVMLISLVLIVTVCRQHRLRVQEGGKLQGVLKQVQEMDQVIAETEAVVGEWQAAFRIQPVDVELEYFVADGGFGDVWKGSWSDSDCAIKMPRKHDVKDYVDAANDEMLNEAQRICKIRHQNVITMFGYGFFDDGRPFIVMEWMTKGTLRACLDRQRPRWSWTTKIRAAADIARGMKYLHSRDFLHRDLKCENCLVNDIDRVKVADFGTSRKLQNKMLSPSDLSKGDATLKKLSRKAESISSHTDIESAALTKGIGSLLWQAPEILEGSAHYGKPADVYSYAIVLWEILTNDLPWEELSTKSEIAFRTTLRTKIFAGERPQIQENLNQNPEYMDLMDQCWATDPLSRPTFATIVLHSVFRSVGYGQYDRTSPSRRYRSS